MPLSPQDAEHSDPFAGTGYYTWPVTGAQPGLQTPATKRDGGHTDPSNSLPNMDQRPMADPTASRTVGHHSDPANALPNMTKSINPRAGITDAEKAVNYHVNLQEQSSLVKLIKSLEDRLNVTGFGTSATVVHSDVAEENSVLRDIPLSGLLPGAGTPVPEVHSDPTLETSYRTGRPSKPANFTGTPGRDGNTRLVTLTWDRPAASERVIFWEILEKESDGVFRPIKIAASYPSGIVNNPNYVINTTPNSLLSYNTILLMPVNGNPSITLVRNTQGTYSFKVRAFTTGGIYSVDSDAADVLIDTTNPANPTNVALAVNADTKVPTVTWTAPADNDQIKNFTVSIKKVGPPDTVVVTALDIASPYVGEAIADAGTYYAEVTARDRQDNVSAVVKSANVVVAI